MSQNLADQAVLKMPEIMDTNLIYSKAFCQMRTNRFNKFPDSLAKSQKVVWQIGSHIFPNRCDDHDPMSFQQERLPILINKAFVCWNHSFEAFQQDVQTLDVVWTSPYRTRTSTDREQG
jgi:hypothetical protein